MKKSIFSIVLLGFLLFSTNFVVLAQDTTTQLEGTTQLPIGEEQDPNRPEGEEQNDNQSGFTEEERNQGFINGLLAGGIVGLILGAIVAWLFKDKFYK